MASGAHFPWGLTTVWLSHPWNSLFCHYNKISHSYWNSLSRVPFATTNNPQQSPRGWRVGGHLLSQLAEELRRESIIHLPTHICLFCFQNIKFSEFFKHFPPVFQASLGPGHVFEKLEGASVTKAQLRGARSTWAQRSWGSCRVMNRPCSGVGLLPKSNWNHTFQSISLTRRLLEGRMSIL